MMVATQHRRSVPPEVLTAEQSVLAAMLRSGDLAATLEVQLHEGDFSYQRNRILFQAVVELRGEGRPVDVVSVLERLEREGTLADAGGKSYVTHLYYRSPDAAEAMTHASIVAENARLRRAFKLAETAARCLAAGTRPPPCDIAQLAEELLPVAPSSGSFEVTSTSQLVGECFKWIEQVYAAQHPPGEALPLPGLSSGYRQLDRLTGGLRAGTLNLLAGVESCGKTAFSLRILSEIAVRSRVPALVLSTGVPAREYVMRLLCHEASLSPIRVHLGQLGTEDWTPLTTAADLVSRAPLHVEHRARIRADELPAAIDRLVSRQKPGLVIVDSLRGITVGDSQMSRTRRAAAVLGNALRLAVEAAGCPLLAISDLPAYDDPRALRRPSLSDLGDPDLPGRADVLLLLHCPPVRAEPVEPVVPAELCVARNRFGPCARMGLEYSLESGKFYEVELFYPGFPPPPV